MKSTRSIKWAGVEFQPNLMNQTRKPVRLGAVLLEQKSTTTSLIVMGRMPILESPPPEFKDIDELALKLASRWVDSMLKDVTGLDTQAVFESLAHRWRWNLYLSTPRPLRQSEYGSLSFATIAKNVYEKFVGLKFEGNIIEKAPRPTLPGNIPPAWQLEEFTRKNVGQRYVA